MKRDDRSIIDAEAGDPSNDLVSLVVATRHQHLTLKHGRKSSQGLHDLQADDLRLNLIHQADPEPTRSVGPRAGWISDVHGDDLHDALLRDELGQRPDVLEVSLPVDQSHHAVHPVHCPALPRVVPTVLGTGQGVEVEQDPDPVFPSPGDGLEEVPVRRSSACIRTEQRVRHTSKTPQVRTARPPVPRSPSTRAGSGPSSNPHWRYRQSLAP